MLSIIRKMQVKTSVRYKIALAGWRKLETLIIPSVSDALEQLKLSSPAGENVKHYIQPLWKTVLQFLKS